MANQDIRCVLCARALNGERPGWNEVERRLYWVDMRAPSLHAFDPVSGHDERWDMPALGGEDLATLFFTSASYPIPETGRGAYPEAGGLFAMEAPVPGLPPDYFQPNRNGHPQ